MLISLNLFTQTGVLALCLFGCLASAQEKKEAPVKKAAPAKPAAPAAKTAAPGAAAKTAGGPTAAAHGPTTATPHGSTTSAPHGATTAATHGPTTSGAHSATTAAAHGGLNSHVTEGPGHPVPGGRSPMAGHGGPASLPTGNRIVHSPGGSEVRMRPNGRPGDVHLANRGMDIHHGLAGERRVEVMRADHSRIVAERGGRGYVQRPYMYHGREFGHRTYYYRGRAYDRFYERHLYHGVYLDVYSPAVYYRPAFYGWAYNPWAAPIAYSWGWGGNPWYGYYGGYFTPYPVYPSASVWLTDYMISQTLASAYQAQADAAAQTQAAIAAGAAPLTPQVKDMIAAEVQRQIALENAEVQGAQAAAIADPGSSSIQRMLTDNIQHVFVAGSSIDVTDASGAECAITQGDALQLAGPTSADATAATLVVLSSKGGQECRTGSNVTVALNDLQDMQNHMRETIDQGMGELQSKQGKGLPPLPASAAAPPVKAAFAQEAPPPDATAGAQLAEQAQQADQAEKETLSSLQSDSGGPSPVEAPLPAAPIAVQAGPPPTLSVGQTIDEVTAIEGAPRSVANVGASKKIYVFADGLKVTFKDGKATDIQ